jgi:putative ABC transport system permease protein
MSASMAVQRTREIGIRKVLGATTAGILKLLASDFLTLLFVSVLAAWPLTYWGIQKWLDGFARRMTIAAGLFVVPLVIVAGATVLTIAANITKAAAANPVEAIKDE